jgi:hypothetical protein
MWWSCMACAQKGVGIGTSRLGSFLLLVVLYGMYAVGRERRYLEFGPFLLLVML